MSAVAVPEQRAERAPALPRSQPRAHVMLPVAIVFLGALLRLTRLQWAQYRRDDAIVLGLAQQALSSHQLPWVGMISTLGIDNGPAQVWLAALALLAGPSPFAAAWGVALLNIVGIAAAYAFGREAFDRRVGLLTALLLAVSSWSVLYSRRLWGNDMLAPFAALAFWSLARVIRRGDRLHQALIWLWAALLAQVYVVALVQLPAIALGFLGAAALRRLRPLPTALGAALFLLLTLPYVLGTVLPELGHLQRLGGGTATVDLTSVRLLAQTVGVDAYQYYLPQLRRLADAGAGPLHLASLLATLLLAAGAAVGLAGLGRGRAVGVERTRSSETRWLLAITLAWVALPVIATARHAVDLFPHYLLGAVPATDALIALALAALLEFRPVAWLGGLTLAILLAGQISSAVAFLADVPNYVRGTEYGVPLQDVEALALQTQQAVRASGARGVLVVGHYDGAELGEALRTWLPNVVVVSDQEGLRIPAGDQRLVLLTTGDDAPVTTFLRQAEDGQAVHFSGDATVFRLFATTTGELRAAAAKQMPTTAPVTLGGDLTLEGSSLPTATPAGGALVWSARWTVTPVGAREKPVASIFAHVLDASEAKVAARDQAFDNQAARWQPGDTILSWVPVLVPGTAATGTDHVLVGLYRLGPAGQIAPLAGPAGADLSLGNVQIIPAGVPSASGSAPVLISP